MDIQTHIKYTAWTKPSASGRKSLRHHEKYVTIQLREAKMVELLPAFSFGDDSCPKIIYSNANRLYEEVDPRQIDPFCSRWEHPLETLKRVFKDGTQFFGYGYGEGNELREMMFNASNAISKYLLVDFTNGTKFCPHYVLYQEVIEPRYCVMTFGSGNGDGGTSLFVTTDGNSSLPLENFFSALDGDLAVAYANKIAEARGDVNDIGTFKATIQVLKEDEVCWPRRSPQKC